MGHRVQSDAKKGRARRAEKDWTKGARQSRGRVGADDDSSSNRGKIRPKGVSIDRTSGDMDSMLRGQVVRTGSLKYDVAIDKDSRTLACTLKRGVSTDNEHATLLAIGDFVRVLPLEDDRGLIYHIEARRSRIGRDAIHEKGVEHVIAANVDLLLCVAAADRHDFRRTIYDRYIVGALLGGITPVIILNKMDTVGGELEELLRQELSVYESIGYPVVYTSTVTGDGIKMLRDLIRDKVTALVGQSGVGKSSLINTLMGARIRMTGEVRQSDRRGVHTTTESAMLKLPDPRGFLIDTPGLREFGIWDLKPQELDGYFAEFAAYLQKCRYLPCTHTHEPACAVRQAVEDGEIDEGRYASYRAILDSLKKGRRS